jgi:hypothetical protein
MQDGGESNDFSGDAITAAFLTLLVIPWTLNHEL